MNSICLECLCWLTIKHSCLLHDELLVFVYLLCVYLYCCFKKIDCQSVFINTPYPISSHFSKRNQKGLQYVHADANLSRKCCILLCFFCPSYYCFCPSYYCFCPRHLKHVLILKAQHFILFYTGALSLVLQDI